MSNPGIDMDSDNFDQHPAQPCQEQLQDQQQIMQCDSVYPVNPQSNGFCSDAIPFASSGSAIPLPAPPQPKKPIPTMPASNEVDIDSILLQQFSCLGTTDHEDLINQFQSLMNNQVNKDSARFYLEMSNWNLQTAVGCYLDLCNFQTLPSMKIIQHSRLSDCQQAWRMQNDGSTDWPNGCYLTSPNQKRRVDVPALKPGDTCDILADIPPTQVSAMIWHLCTPNGWNIGEPIWMVPPSSCDSNTELTQRMAQLLTTTSETTNEENCAQVNVVISVNME